MSCSFLKEKAKPFFIEVRLFHHCGERSLTTSMVGGIMEHMPQTVIYFGATQVRNHEPGSQSFSKLIQKSAQENAGICK